MTLKIKKATGSVTDSTPAGWLCQVLRSGTRAKAPSCHSGNKSQQRGPDCILTCLLARYTLSGFNLLFFNLNTLAFSLADVAQWVKCQPANHKVASLVPDQGTCLGCG